MNLAHKPFLYSSLSAETFFINLRLYALQKYQVRDQNAVFSAENHSGNLSVCMFITKTIVLFVCDYNRERWQLEHVFYSYINN